VSGRIVRGLEIGLFPVLWITKKLMSIPAVWWKRIGISIMSASFGVMAWSRFHAPHGTLTGVWSGNDGFLFLLAQWACLWAAARYVPIAFEALGIAILHRIARMLPVVGHGAFAVTRHTLESREIPRGMSYWNYKSDVSALVATVLVTSGLVAGFTIDRAVARHAEALSFAAMVVAPGTTDGASQSIGVSRATIDPAVISSLEADPNLAVVPYGQVTVGPTRGSTPTATITLVSLTDMDKVTPGGARPLGLQDGVMLSPDPESDNLAFPAPREVIDVSTPAGTATVLNRSWSGTLTLATRDWGEAAWGDIPVVGALVAYVGGDLPADKQFDYVADAARLAGADTRPVPSLSPEAIAMRHSNDTSNVGFIGFMTVFMFSFACLGTVLLSVHTVRKHRQVRATVAALGATPRALALAVPIDAGITLAVATAISVPIGVLVAAVWKFTTLFSLGAPLDLGTTGRSIAWNLSHVGWSLVAAVAVATWALAVAATAVYGFAVARRTPVDELREAIKEGSV
jgi:hypothetical protein